MEVKMYSVAIRRRLNDIDHFWQHEDFEFVECEIDTCSGRYWYADPFVFEKDDVVYLFFEAFDLVQRKGKVGYCIFREDGSCSEPKIIIDEPFHLSFPNVFGYNGNVYIMPEMSGDYSLKLYQAISFPDKWEIADVVLPDVYACDSVLIEMGKKRYVLTNEMYHNVPHGQYASCWVKNYLYEVRGMNAINHGTWVTEGDFGVRNAGKTFEEDDKMFRVGQDCRNRMYGKGLVMFKINSIEPYKEEFLWNLTCEDIQNHIRRKDRKELLGVHTYNFSNHYEVIDFSYMNELKSIIKYFRLHHSILKGGGKMLKFITT